MRGTGKLFCCLTPDLNKSLEESVFPAAMPRNLYLPCQVLPPNHTHTHTHTHKQDSQGGSSKSGLGWDTEEVDIMTPLRGIALWLIGGGDNGVCVPIPFPLCVVLKPVEEPNMRLTPRARLVLSYDIRRAYIVFHTHTHTLHT